MGQIRVKRAAAWSRHKKPLQRISAGVSNLPKKLKARGIENIVITVMLTNFCCETSARDAMMLGYRVVMVLHANAARYADDHRAGFTTLYQSFGGVRTTEEIINDLLAVSR